jgi:hypothetical protein
MAPDALKFGEGLLAAPGVARRKQETLTHLFLLVAARGEQQRQTGEENGSCVHGFTGHYHRSARARQWATREIVNRDFSYG